MKDEHDFVFDTFAEVSKVSETFWSALTIHGWKVEWYPHYKNTMRGTCLMLFDYLHGCCLVRDVMEKFFMAAANSTWFLHPSDCDTILRYMCQPPVSKLLWTEQREKALSPPLHWPGIQVRSQDPKPVHSRDVKPGRKSIHVLQSFYVILQTL